MDIRNMNGMDYLKTLENGEIDLILTDPPYIISHDTGMDKLFEQFKSQGDTSAKTEEDWNVYKETLGKPEHEIRQGHGHGWSKENYIRWGTIYGKKYGTRTNFGDWDHQFTMEQLDSFVQQYFRVLRTGGTCIIWFDIWKITYLEEIMRKHNFKQLRLVEWLKTNPQPINSKTNYLTNSREIAILGVKGSKPTFNSSYDNGVYRYPICSGKYKFHPTQKNLQLFEELIRKHSNEGDTVLDTFLGGGTTAYASKSQNRICKGCELNSDYYNRFMENLQ